MPRRLWLLILPLLLTVLLMAHMTGQTAQTAAPSHVDDLGMMLVEQPEGLYVLAVMEDSPADRCGVSPGDLLTQLEGTPLTAVIQLEKAVQDAASRELHLTLLRGDDPLTVTLPMLIKKHRPAQ